MRRITTIPVVLVESTKLQTYPQRVQRCRHLIRYYETLKTGVDTEEHSTRVVVLNSYKEIDK